MYASITPAVELQGCCCRQRGCLCFTCECLDLRDSQFLARVVTLRRLIASALPANSNFHFRPCTWRLVYLNGLLPGCLGLVSLCLDTDGSKLYLAAMGLFDFVTKPTSYQNAQAIRSLATRGEQVSFASTAVAILKNRPPPHSQHPNFGHLTLLVFEAVLEVVCVSLPGYVVARQGLFDAESQKFLANLNVTLFTPCLSRASTFSDCPLH